MADAKAPASGLQGLGSMLLAVGRMPATTAPSCPYCRTAGVLVDGAAVYPHSPQLASNKFWHCAACAAWVGCHPAGHGQGDGTTPMGRLANAKLRAARQAAHEAFDRLWKLGVVSRPAAYAWLAKALGMSATACHIGEMDVPDCMRVVKAVTDRGERR